MLPDVHVSTVLSTKFSRITLALAIIPLYYSLQFSKKIYGVLIETRGTTLTDGTIVIPEHDNSQFPADEIVNADNVLPYYLRPGVRYIDGAGTEQVATLQTDSPEFRGVGKKVKILVGPEAPKIAWPERLSDRSPDFWHYVGGIFFLALFWLTIWFKRPGFSVSLVLLTVPWLVLPSALESYFNDRHMAAHAQLQEFSIVDTYTREVTYSHKRGMGTRKQKFKIARYENPDGVYYSHSHRNDEPIEVLYVDSERPWLAAAYEPVAPDFWNEKTIASAVIAAFALGFGVLQIVFSRRVRGN